MAHPYARSKVTAVAGTAASLDLSGKAKEMVLSSTTDCWINFNGTAVANTGFYLPADEPITLPIGDKTSVSVIQDTGAGYLSILEMGDVVLINTVHKFFTSNASLLDTNISTIFYGDNNLLRVIAETITGDSLINNVYEDTYTGDSHLAYIISGTFTGDCILITP